MILLFPENQNYEKLILNGEKKITIREDESERWQEGEKIHFATGVKTKDYNCFKEDTVKKIDNIEIIGKNVYINNELLSFPQIENLAKLDGYEDVESFFNFFGEYFQGKIIYW